MKLTNEEAFAWAHSPIVTRVQVSSGVVEETLENGKTYILERQTEGRYVVIGIK